MSENPPKKLVDEIVAVVVFLLILLIPATIETACSIRAQRSSLPKRSPFPDSWSRTIAPPSWTEFEDPVWTSDGLKSPVFERFWIHNSGHLAAGMADIGSVEFETGVGSQFGEASSKSGLANALRGMALSIPGATGGGWARWGNLSWEFSVSTPEGGRFVVLALSSIKSNFTKFEQGGTSLKTTRKAHLRIYLFFEKKEAVDYQDPRVSELMRFLERGG